MNIKLNTICFIILLFLLVGVASAADSNNETLEKTIEQPDEDICQESVDSQDTLKASEKNNEKLELSINNTEKLEKSLTNTVKLEKSKTVKVTPSKISIKASDMKIHYKDGSKFTVTVKDSSKKAIQKIKVNFAINGKTYTKTTDSKGKASLTINLNSGKYTITTTFSGSSKYAAKSVKNTITVKSTIKSGNLAKFYKNKAAYYSTFYDKKGKLLKNTAVKIKINSKAYSLKTNKKGVAKLAVDLKPGTYSVTSVNSKTSETATHTITIYSLIYTTDLTMKENDGSKFCVKVLNSYGKDSPNKIVTLKVNGKTYTPKSDSKGFATQTIDLPQGTYSITTEYDGLKNTNKITVNEGLKHTSFSHISMIPDYVNVTVPYAFHNSAYTVKQGTDGIIKLPKHDVFAIHISETKHYLFSKTPQSDIDTNIIGYKTYLVPFDGSDLKSDYNKDNLKGDGILISKISDYTQIEFRSTTQLDSDMFGLMMDKHKDDIEIITYVQNDLIKARIMFYTNYFDEIGLRSNLGKLYDKNAYEINYNNYDQLTKNNADKIKFTNTGNTVEFTDSRNQIMPFIKKEDITTKLIIDGVEELEKIESISYGHSELYQPLRGFEVLQSYAIINKKVKQETVDNWLKVNSGYMSRIGIMNIYGMFLAGLETAWLADEIADNYANDLNVKWSREKTTTILGGINIDDTYLHILNADMGMKVTGDAQNIKLFRLMNSFYLPNIENNVLKPLGDVYLDNITNSIDNILTSIELNKFSIVQMGEIFYIIDEDGKNSTIMINSTSGVANAILIDNSFTYKGAKVPTTCDCCSVGRSVNDLITDIKSKMSVLSNNANNVIDTIINKAHPLSMLGYMVGNIGAGIASKLGASGIGLGLSSTVGLIMGVHGAGNFIKNNFVDEKDWHWAYEHVTFTRDGYMQSKKFFNIPKSDGTYDYVEVEINSDGSLNRNNALYVSDGSTKKLTKSETYKYFDEETWTPYNIPYKYQKNKMQ